MHGSLLQEEGFACGTGLGRKAVHFGFVLRRTPHCGALQQDFLSALDHYAPLTQKQEATGLVGHLSDEIKRDSGVHMYIVHAQVVQNRTEDRSLKNASSDGTNPRLCPIDTHHEGLVS